MVLSKLVSLMAAMCVTEAGAGMDIPAGYETLHEDGDFKVLIEGSEKAKLGGKRPSVGDRISVHYSGRFEDGDEFDSSYRRERPFVFEVGQARVIACWDQAFLHLSKGMKARLHCPSEYAYGAGGAGRIIPPDAALTFDIELLDINPPEGGKSSSTSSESTSRSQRKRKKSWQDLPAVGDETTHQCFEPIVFQGAFATLMLSFGYFLYACCMNETAKLTRQERHRKREEANKRSKKISEGKIA